MIFQFYVPTMACSVCAETITKAIGNVDLAAIVKIDLAAKQVEVNTADKSEETIKSAIVAAGYPVQEKA